MEVQVKRHQFHLLVVLLLQLQEAWEDHLLPALMAERVVMELQQE
jgi:hypothetical protein